MSAGDVFMLIDQQIYVTADDNPILNVYAYRQASGTGGAEELAANFVEEVLPDIVGVQSVAIGHSSISVVNLDDLSDFTELAVDPGEGTGTQTGDCLPRYNAYSFIYHRTSRGIRNGWKRIAGVPESAQVNGVVTNSGFLTALSALATTLSESLTGSGGDVWNPRILRRGSTSVTPPIVRADFPIASVAFVGLTTQNTRKR